MGYDFKVESWYKIKDKEKKYPWPCKSEPDRLITIYDDDVLTKNRDGTYFKHTGLGCFGIRIPDEDVIPQEKPAHLRLI